MMKCGNCQVAAVRNLCPQEHKEQVHVDLGITIEAQRFLLGLHLGTSVTAAAQKSETCQTLVSDIVRPLLQTCFYVTVPNQKAVNGAVR